MKKHPMILQIEKDLDTLRQHMDYPMPVSVYDEICHAEKELIKELKKVIKELEEENDRN